MAEAERKISTRLQFDGEREYKEACKDINSSLKILGSEMKLVTAEFGSNDKSVDGLTKKQDILKRQFEEQTKKVEENEKALAALKTEGTASADTIARFEVALNNSKAELVKTGKELENTGKDLDEAGKEADQFGNDIKEMSNEAEQSGGKLSKLGEILGGVGKAFGLGMVAIGTAAAGAATALTALTVEGSNYADDLMTQSTYTRQSTDDLQKYAYACRFIDTDMEKLTGSMTKNIKAMANAQDGTGATAEAYRKLGVDVTNADGSLRDSNEVYWETIDALGQITNETERDAMAMQIMGKSGTELNSIIESGSEAFKALGDEAEAMGAVMGGDQLNALGSFNDKLMQLQGGLGGLKNAAAMIALPFLDEIAGEGVKILGDFSKGIQQANGDFGKMADVVGETVSKLATTIAEKLPELIEMGINIIKSLVQGVVDNLPIIIDAALQIVTSLCDALIEMLPLLLDGAMQIVLQLGVGIAQALPELIPKIVELVMFLVQKLVDNIPMLIDCALQLITGLANGVINAIPVLINALPAVINGLISGLLGAIPQIIQAGIDLLVSLVTALPEIIISIVEAIPQIIDGLLNALFTSIPLIIQAGIDLLISLVKALPEIIVTIVKAIPQIVGGLLDAVMNNLPLMYESGFTLLVSLIEALPEIIIELVKAIPTIIMALVDGFKAQAHKIVEVGENLIKGVWDGICNMGNWLKDKISGFFGGVVDGIKGFLGIHSPSTVFAGIGENMAEGLSVGFAKEMRGVERDIKNAIPTEFDVKGSINDGSVNERLMRNERQQKNAPSVVVNQYINGNERDYRHEQREAAKQFKLIARMV